MHRACLLQGLLVAGCPVGKPTFVQAYVDGVADNVLSTIATLMELGRPVRAQDKLLLLRKSLQHKVAHFIRCVNRELLLKSLERVEIAVRDAFLTLINRRVVDIDEEQLHLPLRFGGIGLQRWSIDEGIVCDAGLLASAALTTAALADGSEAFLPLNGAGLQQFEECWQRVRTFLAQSGAVPVQLSLQDALQSQCLSKLQRSVSLKVQEAAKSRLFRKYQVMDEGAGLPWVRSSSWRVYTVCSKVWVLHG